MRYVTVGIEEINGRRTTKMEADSFNSFTLHNETQRKIGLEKKKKGGGRNESKLRSDER